MPRNHGTVTYRLARETDVERTYEVMLEAESDLARKLHMSTADLTLPDKPRAIAARAASLADFPGRFWVAEDGRTVVGFGISYLRERHWHLKSLQVVPAYQGMGIGGELMRRCASAIPPRSVRSVVSEAIQPISNALYVRAGMYPRLIVYAFSGDPAAAVDRSLGAATGTRATLAERDELDRSVLGYARRDAHRLWRAAIGDDRLVTARTAGRVVGYGYAASDGAIGPAIGRSPSDVRAVIGLAMARLAEEGCASASVLVPGTLRPVVDRLLTSQFRIGAVPLIYMASGPVGGFRLQPFSPDGVL